MIPDLFTLDPVDEHGREPGWLIGQIAAALAIPHGVPEQLMRGASYDSARVQQTQFGAIVAGICEAFLGRAARTADRAGGCHREGDQTDR